MGFGLLFFGYFAAFLMSFNSFGSIFALIGYYVMFIALQKLSEYTHSITYCIPSLIALFFCAVTDATNLIFKSLDLAQPFSGTVISYAISLLSLTSSLIFHIFLLTAISELGRDTELPEVIALTKTNIAAVSAYFILNVVVFILNLFKLNFPLLIVVTLLLRIAYPVFVLALIYKCFSKICAPDDVDMPIKPSRFKFINDIRERQQKKSEETRAASEEILKNKKKK